MTHASKSYFTGEWPGLSTQANPAKVRANALKTMLIKQRRQAGLDAVLNGNKESARISREAQENLDLLTSIERELEI